MEPAACSALLEGCCHDRSGLVPPGDRVAAVTQAPTREQLLRFRDARVPDLVGAGLRLLIVGINPGLWTAAVQAHFAHPANRFYSALFRAGITDHRIDASRGMSDADASYLVDRGLGITNLVHRATARASEVSAAELRAGTANLARLEARWSPAVVAVLGVTAYRHAFERPRAAVGPQPERLRSAPIWVLPNPSGLNAHETIESLASAYSQAARAAGIRLLPRDGQPV
jgi:TDG/mug DNA glycosylase family protein